MNKKFVSMLSLLVAVLFAAFTACSESGKDDAEKKISEERVYAIVDKYDDGKIEEKDFAEAIDIFNTYQNMLLAEAEKQLSSCKTDREFSKKMDRFVNKYAFLQELMYLFSAPESQMGKDNYSRLMKIQQDYQAKMGKIQAKIEEKYYKNEAPAAMPAGNGADTNAVAPAPTPAESASAAPAPASVK